MQFEARDDLHEHHEDRQRQHSARALLSAAVNWPPE